MVSPWAYLFVAGLFEITLALGLKYSNGLTRLAPSLLTLVSTVISFFSLAQAVKFLPIGLAYAIWTGIGAVGVTLVGVFFLGESLSILKLACVLLIILGIVGLKFG